MPVAGYFLLALVAAFVGCILSGIGAKSLGGYNPMSVWQSLLPTTSSRGLAWTLTLLGLVLIIGGLAWTLALLGWCS